MAAGDLVVEDGSIVANANTYATVQQVRDFAALRGLTVPAAGSPGDDEIATLLIKAMDYLRAQETRYKGCRVSAVQRLSWPRAYVQMYPGMEYIAITDMPSELIDAQCQLAIIAQTIDLLPTATASNSNIKRRKVGPLETEFFSPGMTILDMETVDSFLAVLYRDGGNAFNITVDRA